MKEMFDLMNPLQEKRLDELTKAIVEKFKPLQILCFSTNFRVDAALSCFLETRVIESCDYELLTVTESSESTEDDFQDFTREVYHNGKVVVLNLNKEDMEKAIESKNLYVTT